MNDFHENFFVITGAPGSGKTTLLHSLEDRHFAVMAEAGRSIILDQTAIGGNALPWEDKRAYAELMLNWDIRSYREAPERNRPVLFDRGIPDIIGYLEFNNIPVPAHLTNAAKQSAITGKFSLPPTGLKSMKRMLKECNPMTKHWPPTMQWSVCTNG